MSSRWNYKVVQIKPYWLGLKPKQIEEILGPLGAMGWELVTVTQVGMNAYLYLKKDA
ncbi:DUF4177 domain-containing protein [Thermomonas sp.]|uniref:DUF4177 domain-containing protein n=1 Tax=Thermomonas sp. TaxID=1971895 RepID=UPI0024883AE5|nr:DUF4177 domain-containing protein [Thermomonas sp.]MDI1251952.1 DUF4177 domain-containing protein [Thermomonas sp.]